MLRCAQNDRERGGAAWKGTAPPRSPPPILSHSERLRRIRPSRAFAASPRVTCQHARHPSGSAHHHQIVPRVVQELAPRLGAGDAVLDADAKPARDVDTRLVAEDHAGAQWRAVAADQVRLLVDIEAEAVTDAVDEVL